MVLPVSLRQRLMPSEIQFLSENEQITILPRYSMKKLDLIGVCNNDSEHKNKVK